MGKVPTAAAATAVMKNRKKKKKGRPPKNPLPLSASPPPPPLSNSTGRRSTRRNPNHSNSPPQQPEFDDDDDERKEKKVKLVVRLPESDDKSKVSEKQSRRHSRYFDSGSGSGSGSDPESEDREGCAKKRKIDGVDGGSDGGVSDQDKEDVKATNTPPDGSGVKTGSPMVSGPTTPLPDKKLLIFILDRLQKKDTYGVFSEPVDPNEIPDYFEIIERPMDFGTVRKKLGDRAYKNLEELEADVLLICSNAMQYNASDTVYYRQARSIEELAKRDFKNLRAEGDNGEPLPKVVRRGRPPNSKNQKKSPETSPADRVATELSSGATLANGEDKETGSNSYNLRKGPALFRYNRSTDPFVSSYTSRNGENHSEWQADWNNEFPASILRADMKHGKKHFTVDENRRDTYRKFHPLPSANNSSVFINANGNMKRLVPLGLQEALAYARSLARYAANLGPVAWKMASKKIETVLPAGVQYGPGWVGDNDAPSQPLSFPMHKQKTLSNSTAPDGNSSKPMAPSTDNASSLKTPFPTHQNPMHHHSYRNGFSGAFGYDSSARGTSVKVDMPDHSLTEGGISDQAKSLRESRNNLPPPPGYEMVKGKASDSHGEGEMWNSVKSSRRPLSMEKRHISSVPPDLNVRVPAGSSPTSSSLQIGSPQQPDLALQL